MNARSVYLVGVLLVYGGLWFSLDGLSFETSKDEEHFWPTSQLFSHTFPPSLEQLRSYNELNTPLPFVVFGLVEKIFDGGIAYGRHVNFLLSILVLLMVAWPRANDDWQRVRSGAGLLLFPYFLGVSVHLYTDMMALFFVIAGLSFHRRERPIEMAISFVLAIACRQYMLSFPAAIFIYEFIWGQRRLAWAALMAVSSIVGWVLFFGGLAPPVAVAAQTLPTASVLTVFPAHSLYFLACVGAYYVMPEYVLFQRWQQSGHGLEKHGFAWILVALVAVLFLTFPPIQNVDYSIPTMGFLDRGLRALLSTPWRIVVLALLAMVTVLRFARVNLVGVLLLANSVILLKSHIGWDKYALAMIATLWLCHGRDSAVPPVTTKVTS